MDSPPHAIKFSHAELRENPKKAFRNSRYYEAYASKQDAVKREHNLKLRAKALKQLKNRINLVLRHKLVWCGGEIIKILFK